MVVFEFSLKIIKAPFLECKGIAKLVREWARISAAGEPTGITILSEILVILPNAKDIAYYPSFAVNKDHVSSEYKTMDILQSQSMDLLIKFS